MKTVRLGIIGLGNMGATHARQILAGKIPRLTLTAATDTNPARAAEFPAVRFFPDRAALLASGLVDAVLIATPHFAHTDDGIAALRAGVHVLVEKPLSVQKADGERLLAAHRRRRQVFGIMFNQRTDRFFQKIRALVQGGELGAIRRVQWTITDWFRPEAYYQSSPWRATWGGEGGGVLLNQSPHQLDLFCWIFGRPRRVRAFCRFGRYHDIEVEDDVTAWMEFADGATATFITSTGEAPGTNRLEIAGERGRLVYETDRLGFTRNEVPAAEFSRTTTQLFARPDTWDAVVPAAGHGGQHNEILENFTAAILDRASLLAPAADGLHSVELANAMLLSTWTGRTVELPMRSATYARWLQRKIAGSRHWQKIKSAAARPPAAAVDFARSFGR